MAVSLALFVLLGLIFGAMLILPEIYIWKIILACLLLIPAAAQGIITGTSFSVGGILNLSIVGYATILAFFILLTKRKKLKRTVTVNILICLSIILFIRVVADGMNVISNKIFDNYFLPMLLAIMMISWGKVEYLPILLKFAYRIIFFGAIVACIEYVIGQSLFYHDYYMEYCPWYVNLYRSSQYVPFRSCSIFGHPLTGAVYYIFGCIYLLNYERSKKKKVMWLMQLLILLGAIFTTNSRSALLGLGIYIVYYLFKNKKYKEMILLALPAVILLLAVDWVEVYRTLFARDNSGSSYMVRVRAIMAIPDFPIRTILLGEGYNNTSALLAKLGFTSNVEIAYLIILIENGVIGFCAWLASILCLYRNNMSRICLGHLRVAEIVRGMFMSVMIVGSMSNSFGDPGTLNYMIYLILAFSYILAQTKKALDRDNGGK